MTPSALSSEVLMNNLLVHYFLDLVSSYSAHLICTFMPKTKLDTLIQGLDSIVVHDVVSQFFYHSSLGLF